MLLSEKQNQNRVKNAKAVLRALDHKLRRSILETIQDAKGKITVTEIYKKLFLEQSVASQHLGILRRAGAVTTQREGKFIYYSVNETALSTILQLCDSIVRTAKSN